MRSIYDNHEECVTDKERIEQLEAENARLREIVKRLSYAAILGHAWIVDRGCTDYHSMEANYIERALKDAGYDPYSDNNEARAALEAGKDGSIV